LSVFYNLLLVAENTFVPIQNSISMAAEIQIYQLFRKCPDGMEVLKGICLEIKKGCFFVLLGPNGAGKSTLLWILTGQRVPLFFLLTRELIKANWLLFISWGTPITYRLEGDRYLLAVTSSLQFFILALIIFTVTSVLAKAFAWFGSQKIKV
jgi:hypothetical protein